MDLCVNFVKEVKHNDRSPAQKLEGIYGRVYVSKFIVLMLYVFSATFVTIQEDAGRNQEIIGLTITIILFLDATICFIFPKFTTITSRLIYCVYMMTVTIFFLLFLIIYPITTPVWPVSLVYLVVLVFIVLLFITTYFRRRSFIAQPNFAVPVPLEILPFIISLGQLFCNSFAWWFALGLIVDDFYLYYHRHSSNYYYRKIYFLYIVLFPTSCGFYMFIAYGDASLSDTCIAISAVLFTFIQLRTIVVILLVRYNQSLIVWYQPPI